MIRAQHRDSDKRRRIMLDKNRAVKPLNCSVVPPGKENEMVVLKLQIPFFGSVKSVSFLYDCRFSFQI